MPDEINFECECDLRYQDQPHKEEMLAEIHLAYDEILQLE
jgi:hypothetical protein